MASRMDRYHSTTNERAKRSYRNEKLYDTIYSDDIEYSNVEGIAKIEKTNEIDLNRIKEMLRKEEEKNKAKRFQPVFKKNISFPEPNFDDNKEERNYDIRDILSQAKKEKMEEENDKYRNLKNTQYNILKNIKLDDEIINKKPSEIEESEQLKELIHTITNTSMLNKLNDQDLSLDLLKDLKSDDTNTSNFNRSSIKEILEEEKEKHNTSIKDNTSDYDKSFFTSSLNFSDDDFEELREISSTYHRNNRLIKILIFIIVIAVIIMIALFFMNMPK